MSCMIEQELKIFLPTSRGDCSSLMQLDQASYVSAIMDTVADRIKNRLKDLNLSARKAAIRAGLPQARVRDILNGKSLHPRSDTISALAPILEVTASWLASGSSSVETHSLREDPLPFKLEVPRSVTLPIRYRVEAGAWYEIDDAHEPYGHRDVPASPRFSSFTQWLEEVSGDSLDLLIRPGSLVHVIDAIDMGYVAADGDVVVVERRRGGTRERTLKQVEVTGRKTLLWPRSSNPRWSEPLDLSSGLTASESDVEVEIVGLVIADFRSWK